MVSWSCNYVLCRVFVHPLLKRFAAPQVSEEAVAEHISLLVDSKLKDFSSRIDAVENEVKKIRGDFLKFPGTLIF